VGRATSRRFAARGADVALLARGEAGLDAAAADVVAAGGKALPLALDVADPDQVAAAGEKVTAELGPIDVWVNNAFASVFAPFREITPDEFRRVTEVTYLGYVNGTRTALEHMRLRGQGTIVQVGSALAYRGIPLQSAYCGAKHAIQGFTESVRCELAHEHSGVRLTMVQLPAVNTPQFGWVLSRLRRRPRPVPPIYQPELAARAVVWAAEHDRREWWVGASTAATLVANAVAPGLLDRYLARTGYDSQLTSELAEPDRPANLWGPADDSEDWGAHGDFDDRAHPRSVQWALTRHRRAVLGAGTAVAGAGAAAAWRAARR
jgi:NAD(P)-dependent dehydrogenase (short-subunit alcohol dehydrogenase family)